MMKKKKLTVAILTTCVVLASAVLLFAAEDPHTPVASDGSQGVRPATESFQGEGMGHHMQPFAGSGMIAEAARLQALEGAPSAESIRALTPVSANNGIESVIDEDSRIRNYTTTFPATATALVTFDGGWCTGWIYGPNVVATMGHCVHTGGSTGSWRTNVRVYPGYDAGSAPFGSYPATSLHSVVGWTVNGNEQYDYGVIKLGTNVGYSTGWFGTFWQATSLVKYPSIIIGYPGDKSPALSQWTSADVVGVAQTRQVFYKNDTSAGQSGSAVWQDRPAGSSYCANGPCVYAIHGYGLHGSTTPHNGYNHGTRITKDVYNNLVYWNGL